MAGRSIRFDADDVMAGIRDADVIVIGGGQAGLALGFYLRRSGEDFLILDDQETPGGAWQHMWPSLRLFSPAEYSSLPGWMMPPTGSDEFPSAGHVVDYLTRYEQRYELPIVRPVHVDAVRAADGGFIVDTSAGSLAARTVMNATGTWAQPFKPNMPGNEEFSGRQLHTVDYRGPEDFTGLRVAVVGGGNSGAQILAEISTVADTTWITRRPPRFLPDDVDGRVLFELASRRYRAQQDGRNETDGIGALGDIVMVPPVRDARARGVLRAQLPIAALAATGLAWPDGRRTDVDAIVWCTGFRPALNHLTPLHLPSRPDGSIPTTGPTSTLAAAHPGLYLVGYGNWTGPASATLIGAARTARDTIRGLTAANETHA